MRKPSKLVTSKNSSFCFLIFSLLSNVKNKKNSCFFKVDSTTLTPKLLGKEKPSQILRNIDAKILLRYQLGAGILNKIRVRS